LIHIIKVRPLGLYSVKVFGQLFVIHVLDFLKKLAARFFGVLNDSLLEGSAG